VNRPFYRRRTKVTDESDVRRRLVEMGITPVVVDAIRDSDNGPLEPVLTTIYIAGFVPNTVGGKDHSWELVGVFSSDTLAADACRAHQGRDGVLFSSPMILNEVTPIETSVFDPCNWFSGDNDD